MTEPTTRWRIVGIPPAGDRPNVELAVATTAPAVVDAIEQAAADNGITLERIPGEEASASPPEEAGGVAADQGEGVDQGDPSAT